MSTRRPSSAASKPADTAAANPWRFLTALDGTSEIDRRLVQATRRDEVQLISHMVAAARVSVLYSFSGNGKSSIVNAGLIPFLTENRYAVFRVRPRPPWSIDGPTQAFKESILRDVNLPLLRRSDLDLLRRARGGLRDASKAEQDQLDSLIARLEEQARASAQSERDTDAFKADLKHHADRPLAEFIGRVQQRLDADTTLAFICDQFEELFVHFGNTPVLEEFVAQLGEVWADSALRVRILFSMREDWVGSLIEFRKAIPDIFRDYFKLKPITRSRAGHVLTLPLESVGASIEPAAVDAILDDMAVSYQRTQQERFSEIHLTLSPADDPFIELPALQVVADRLWTTRNGTHKPFSLAHYRSLGSNGAEGAKRKVAPAQLVLDEYLSDLLERLQNAGDQAAHELFELRIDCLYLLTDRVRHRRALPEGLLLEELKQIRAQGLNLPAVATPQLREALGPLQQARLVREDVSRSGDRQYELAHDFAVRSVVAAWRQLDRERTAALALLEQERKHTERKFAALQGADERSMRLLQMAPIFGLGTLVVAMLLDATGFFYGGHRLLLGLPFVTFLTILIGGLVRGHTPSAVLAGAGLLGIPAVSMLASYDAVPGIAALIAALVPFYLWSAHRLNLQMGSTRFARLLATLWTEYVEVLKILPALALPAILDELTGRFELGLTLGIVLALVMTSVSARQVAVGGGQFGSLWTGVRVARQNGQPLSIGLALGRQLALLVWIALVVLLSVFVIRPGSTAGMVSCGLLAALSWVAGATFIPSLNQNRHVYDLVSGAYPGSAALLPAPAAHVPRPFAAPKVVVRVYAPAFGIGVAGIGLITLVEVFFRGGAGFGFVLSSNENPFVPAVVNRLISVVAGGILAAAGLAFMFRGTRRLAAWAILVTFTVQALFVVLVTLMYANSSAGVAGLRRLFDFGEIAALALTFLGLATTDGERAVKRTDAARLAFAIALIGQGASWFLVWSWGMGAMSLWSTALQVVSFVAGALILRRRRASEACFALAGMLVLNVIVSVVSGNLLDRYMEWSVVWGWVPWTLASIAGTAAWGVLLAPRPADAPITSAEFERT